MNRADIQQVFQQTPAVDMHTHLFPFMFGAHALSGVDDLLTYHYLEAEYFRLGELPPEQYFALPKAQRADTIWDALFVRNTPISEAASGVTSVFSALEIDTGWRTLDEARRVLASRRQEDHLTHVLDLANIRTVVMTNDPLDPREAAVWLEGKPLDSRFRAALRLDRILQHADTRWAGDDGLRRFLHEWVERMQPVYMAISLPGVHPLLEESEKARRMRDVVLPLCHELGLPFALMLGVRRGVNPRIGVASDASCRVDLTLLGDLCARYPDNRFLVTCLSLENQHELCVLARKFATLTPFGCWWFVNNISTVRTITEQRLEMLGTTFIAQHSDARVLEQLIYKWRNARSAVGAAYADVAARLSAGGYELSREAVTRDAELLLHGNFAQLCSRAT